ncbi:hypothetical protein Tco_0882076 [Tanacetum coccineum]
MASLDYRLNPLFTIKECSSYGYLYNKGYCCTPNSSQQPLHDCPKCGNPVEGPNCQGCALWRKKLKEVWFTIFHENGIYQDLLNTYKPSDDDTNVVNAPREPFVVKQDPGENSLQSPLQINHNCCYECGDSLDDIFCQRCTCKSQENKRTTAQSFTPYWNFSMIDDEEARDNFLKDVCTFLRKFSRIPFGVTPKVILLASESFGKIKDALMDKQYQQEDCRSLQLILQMSSAIHHLSNNDNMYIKSYSFISLSLHFQELEAIYSGYVNPLATRKVHVHGRLKTISTLST